TTTRASPPAPWAPRSAWTPTSSRGCACARKAERAPMPSMHRRDHDGAAPLERAWPWLGATVVGAVALIALALAGADGALFGQRPEDRVLRGYTASGVFLGIAAVVLALLAVSYSLRKRPLQEKLPPGRGSMTAWLWLHVAAGILAVVAATLHAGRGML